MEYKVLAMTLGPGLAICIYVYWRDKFDREPLIELIRCFVLGVISTTVALSLSTWLSGYFPENGDSLSDTASFAYIAVALSEEFAKFFFLVAFPFRKRYFDEPYDGITYAVMISMGFATLENVLYVYSGKAEAVDIAYARMFTAVPAHATFGVAMGYFAGLAKFSNNRPLLMLAALGVPVIMHGTYDFLLFQRSIPQIAVGALVALILSVYFSLRAIRAHQRRSPFNTGISESEEV